MLTQFKLHAPVYVCLLVCNDGNVFASRLCRVRMSPVSHCEMIKLKTSLSSCSIEQQVEPRCANPGKESRKAASWTGRVSSPKKKKRSQRKWMASVSKDSNNTQTLTWFTGLLRQHKSFRDSWNTSNLTDKQMRMFQVMTEGYMGQRYYKNCTN